MNIIEKDFILTWDWEYDADFIRRFDEMCQNEGVNAIFINPANLNEIHEQVHNNRLRFKVLLDRASDTDETFDPFIDRIILSGTKTLNEARHAIKAVDKATMHLEFLVKGIDVPYSIIFSPSNDFDQLTDKAIDKIGRPFIIKPAHGGGGEGVEEAESVENIEDIHNEHEEDKYLLQEKVFPIDLNGKQAYFRIFYVCGHIIPCWWNDKTHVFGDIVNKEEEKKYGLRKLKDITKKIAAISKLDFFSTEICITKHRRFVVVDYVNDPCDMRLKSRCADGVPDNVVERIIKYIIQYITRAKREQLTPLKQEFIKRRRDFELKLLRRYR